MEQNTLPTIKWSGYEWLLQERWGQVHPAKSHWWYDPMKVAIDLDGFLHLKTGKSEKYFEHLNHTSLIGAGLVSCITPFSFGTFSIKAKLPYGKNLWPSFWLWSWSDWPPEVDVFEGYSDFSPDYRSLSERKPRMSFLDKLLGRPALADLIVKPNVHFKSSDGDHTALSTLYPEKDRLFRTKRDLTASFSTYKLVWVPASIEIYYGDTLVLYLHEDMSISIAKILEQIAQHKMNVVINNGVTSFVNLHSPPVSDFVIESFTYQPYLTV